jgi:hypothetical protein
LKHTVDIAKGRRQRAGGRREKEKAEGRGQEAEGKELLLGCFSRSICPREIWGVKPAHSILFKRPPRLAKTTLVELAVFDAVARVASKLPNSAFLLAVLCLAASTGSSSGGDKIFPNNLRTRLY